MKETRPFVWNAGLSEAERLLMPTPNNPAAPEREKRVVKGRRIRKGDKVRLKPFTFLGQKTTEVRVQFIYRGVAHVAPPLFNGFTTVGINSLELVRKEPTQ